MTNSVLIVEDEPGLREGLVTAVETLGLRALSAAGVVEARRVLAVETVDCVLLDIRLRDGDGIELLGELRKGPHREVPVIMATAYGDSERTIAAMRDGAFDYLTKPFDFPTLLATVSRAVKQRTLAVAALPESAASSPQTRSTADSIRAGLVGSSAAMLATWKLIGRAASADAPVLVTGETGTGKELVARAIHEYSARARLPFVGVNLAALPPTLLESELFGHERGAFTGAQSRRAGRLESAGAGTLFLDEIGDLDAALQTKLLRVMADGAYERVGGDERLTSSARIVSATNKPVRPGEPGCVLREDLYYRLAVIEICVPPLRERRSDVPLLVAHALADTTARAVSEEAMARLLAYRWPGNVRELLHVIQRAAVLSGGEIIDLPHLPLALQDTRTEEVFPLNATQTALKGSGLSSSSSSSNGSTSEDETLSLREAVARLERRMIVAALSKAGGNRSEAARQLGIGRPLLYAKMQEYGVGDRSNDGNNHT